MPTSHEPASAIRRATRKLGADIKDARRRRKLTATIVAARAFTTRQTLRRIEAGDHLVGIGIYASVLHVLGLLDDFADIADISNDKLGQLLSIQSLPDRVRMSRKQRK